MGLQASTLAAATRILELPIKKPRGDNNRNLYGLDIDLVSSPLIKFYLVLIRGLQRLVQVC